jgi:ribosomal protein S27AE
MPQKQTINLANVLAVLDRLCPKCGHAIAPAELRRVDFERVECPKCGERFIAGRTGVS